MIRHGSGVPPPFKSVANRDYCNYKAFHVFGFSSIGWRGFGLCGVWGAFE